MKPTLVVCALLLASMAFSPLVSAGEEAPLPTRAISELDLVPVAKGSLGNRLRCYQGCADYEFWCVLAGGDPLFCGWQAESCRNDCDQQWS